MSAVQPQPINEDKMHAFLGKVVGDFGAALSSSLVYIGQKLGLFKAMAEAGPITPEELAQKILKATRQRLQRFRRNLELTQGVTLGWN